MAQRNKAMVYIYVFTYIHTQDFLNLHTSPLKGQEVY